MRERSGVRVGVRTAFNEVVWAGESEGEPGEEPELSLEALDLTSLQRTKLQVGGATFLLPLIGAEVRSLAKLRRWDARVPGQLNV